ncbi:hypothetical protein EMIHUDRAFT_455270 [Emiliania huxleyi CCMP1516]|uniref:Uncharacterized protein n=4 Tax=Emiliania huxleyi TaxID=2903 RepID=A0A0D3KJ22_EMIH1|nr:hypothetical protein EMIHUDRAFT_455270 [Emiliania huxleyi CCMP1516]EOD35757.1 hypothetical protein EMIHUDRAFT_455270 [Emiliania huxleyi CCMP1516]|eukprot:XP_005788186.1 hypothetical protein EMIHUDRAFT_455270 [Emiliania huxleyi CCMP1516]
MLFGEAAGDDEAETSADESRADPGTGEPEQTASVAQTAQGPRWGAQGSAMSMDPRFPATGEAPYMSVLKGDTFFARTFPNYKKMFFDKGSFRPVVHAMLVVGFIGYTLDYFQHLRFERHSYKEKHLGGH